MIDMIFGGAVSPHDCVFCQAWSLLKPELSPTLPPRSPAGEPPGQQQRRHAMPLSLCSSLLQSRVPCLSINLPLGSRTLLCHPVHEMLCVFLLLHLHPCWTLLQAATSSCSCRCSRCSRASSTTRPSPSRWRCLAAATGSAPPTPTSPSSTCAPTRCALRFFAGCIALSAELQSRPILCLQLATAAIPKMLRWDSACSMSRLLWLTDLALQRILSQASAAPLPATTAFSQVLYGWAAKQRVPLEFDASSDGLD